MNNYPEVVKQIHDEFNIAGERLLQESLSIINQSERVDLEKIKDLNQLGFFNNPQLKRALEIEKETRMSATLAKAIQAYAREFLGYKFISTEDVNRINQKYNLCFCGVEDYTGFVPVKNLKEIADFSRKFPLNYRFKIKKVTFSTYDTLSFSFVFGNNAQRALNKHLKSVNSVVQNGPEYTLEAKLKKAIVNVKSAYYINEVEAEKISPFMICAPEKDIKESKNKTLFEVKAIPDPIVLYPVDMGFIIVTAWGDEASDPLVVNEQMN